MAVTRSQAIGSGHGGAGGFGSQTATFASAVNSGDLLVCAYWGNSNTGNATCSDNVNGAWTALTQQTPVAGSGRRMNWFYKLNSAAASAGAMTVTLSPNASSGNTEMMQIAAYAGVASYNASALAYAAQTSASTTWTQASAAGTLAGDLLLYAIAFDNDTGTHTLTPTVGVTSMVFGTGNTSGGGTNGSAIGLAFAEKLSASAGANTLTCTVGTSDVGGKYVIGFTASTGSTITKTQTATARIAVSVTKTQPAIARIANTRTKTQSALARIAATLTKTQSATAKILPATVTTKTQTAIARIANIVTKTQSAVARIANNSTKTQSAIARIANTKTKTQTAIARVANTRTKTQSAVARVANNSTKTQSAVARIANARTKTQSAIARISNVRTKTQSAVARIARTSTFTQFAIARIANTRTKTQSALARIASDRTKTQTATARVVQAIIVTKTQTARARISNTFTKTQTATAYVKQTVYKFNPPVGNGPVRGETRFWRNYRPIPTGRSVLKIDGEYIVKRYPKPREIRAAEIVYIGGHEHTVSKSEADDLIAAGYAVEVIL